VLNIAEIPFFFT